MPNTLPTRAAAVVACLGMLVIASHAYAQFGGRSPDGGRERGGESRRAHAAEQPRIDLFEATIHELREDLKLSPAQRPAWDAYESRVRALAADLKRARAAHAKESERQETAPQRIDRLVDIARDRLAALEDIADAANALYAGFTPEQKAIADARLASVVPNAEESAERGAPAADMREGARERRARDGAP